MLVDRAQDAFRVQWGPLPECSSCTQVSFLVFSFVLFCFWMIWTNALISNVCFTPSFLSRPIQYSVTSLKTIPALCRRCDSQNEDRPGRSLFWSPWVEKLLESGFPGFGSSHILLLSLLPLPPYHLQQTDMGWAGHLQDQEVLIRTWLCTNQQRSSCYLQTVVSAVVCWKLKKAVVAKHIDAGANEKMLDAFTTHMATTNARDGALPKSETLSGCYMLESAVRHTITVKMKARRWSLIV